MRLGGFTPTPPTTKRPGYSDGLGWIPAFAGMTVGGGIDSGGGNDGREAEMTECRASHLTALTVIPAQAGIQNPGGCRLSDGQGWIPAFAGVTV